MRGRECHHAFHSHMHWKYYLPALFWELHLTCGAQQVTYNGNTTMRHGDVNGLRFAGSFTLAPDEQIISVHGRSGVGLDSLGFTTSKGNIYGPWGGTGGGPYRINGPVCGFHGGRGNGGSLLNAIGVWTISSPGSPPPPSKPPPPPIPGMIQSPMFGGQSNLSSTWDDGASFAGHRPSPALCEDV
jgi:hypothetical protein